MTSDAPVRSPCVNMCALDEHDICIACSRTASEITRWPRLSNDEKRDVLRLCRARDQAAGRLL